MKNIGKILLLSFMTIGLVTGCDLADLKNFVNTSSSDSGAENKNSDSSNEDSSGNNYEGDSNSNSSNSSSSSNAGSSGNSSSSSSSSSSSGGNVNNPTWTEADIAIMREHLYGVVLPYVGSEDTVVEYDADYDMVTLTGGDVDIIDFEEALLKDGFDLVGEQEDEYGFYFAVEKAVNTEQGRRFVYVYAEDDEEEGFSAQAFDPYYYAYPADAIAAFFEDWEATPYAIPEITADYYSFEEDSGNWLYVLFDMNEYVNATLIGFGCSETYFNSYLDELETAGWDVEESEYEGEVYYACQLETDAGVASVDVMYSADFEAIGVTMYAYMSAADIDSGTFYETWPAAAVAQLLGNSVTDTLPEYTGENNGFKILNDMFGTAVQVLVADGTETAGVTAYLEILDDAHYYENGVDEYYDTVYTSPNGQIDVTVYFATTGSFTITFKKSGSSSSEAVWPAEEIAYYLGSSVTDAIPAFEGANEYAVYPDDEDGSVQVKAYFDTLDEAEAAQEQYVGLLKTALYTEAGEDIYGDMYYNSPNKQVNICPWVSTSYGEYKLIVDIFLGEFVAPETSWPTAKVNAALENAGFSDELPAFNDGYFYEVEDYGDSFFVSILVDDPEDAIDAYSEILEVAEFELVGTDSYDGSPYYESPNGEYTVNPYAYDEFFVIAVY